MTKHKQLAARERLRHAFPLWQRNMHDNGRLFEVEPNCYYMSWAIWRVRANMMTGRANEET